MSKWDVTGYRVTHVMMSVEAETREDALEKAKAGLYLDVDTEPGHDLWPARWIAKPALLAAPSEPKP